jgi:tetratricopeptide (TPR) repeat protein
MSIFDKSSLRVPAGLNVLATLALVISSQGLALAQTSAGDSAAAGDSVAEETSAHSSESLATTEKATRLFKLGRELMAEEAYDAACRKFEESLALVAGLGTRYNLADCYEKLGHKAKAYRLFADVSAATQQAGQDERYEAAVRRTLSLEAELGSLRIELAGSGQHENVEILVDDAQVPPQALGERYFVDPGEHQMKARAPGKLDLRETLTVAAGETLAITVPELATASTVSEEQEAPAEEPPVAAVSEDASDELPSDSASAWIWLPPTALGIGAAGLFAGIAYTQQYRASHEDARAVCPSSYGCTRGEVELHEELVNDERHARTRALIGYGVATAALATAAVYYLWAPVKQEESGTAASLTLAPLVGAELAGGVLDVTF